MTNISPANTRIGWIGTGVMGASMCGHLMRAGFAATVFNRTKAKAEKLLSSGAAWADSPKAVAEASDVVFTIVGYPADVRSVILGPDGVLAGCTSRKIGDCPDFRVSENGTVPFGPTKIIVDMTTSQPSLAVEIARAAAEIGVHAVDAPVSGGDVGAREAKLSIMIGGDNEVVEALNPCWQAMGKTFVHQGPAGAGQHAKLTNQILVAANMIGVCESLLYAFKAGLDLNKVLQSVAPGAAGSWTLSNLAPRIIANNFAPGFFVEHFIKDMGIILDECRRMGLCLPGLALVHQLYISLKAQGHGRDGTQALHLALSSMSNIDWINR
jgi:3-hydroxyisobutyrate dehydrogenase